MVNEDKLRKKAKVALNKAEILLDNEEYKKSASQFKKAGEIFALLQEWKVAEQCFFYASKNLTRLGKYYQAALAEREAANDALRLLDYQKARDYFSVAAKSVLKAAKSKLEEFAAENIGFAFLCYFVQGKYQEGITYVKRFKAQIGPDLFNSNLVLKIVQHVTNAVINKNEKHIDDLLDNYSLFQYSEMENLLIKESLVVALASLMVLLEIPLEETEYERDSLIEVNAIVDTSRLCEFANYRVVPHEFTLLNISELHINIGDNLSIKERPELPIKLNFKEFGKEKLRYILRSNIPGTSFIGPIKLVMNVDGKFNFSLESERKDIKITSPDAVLGITLTPQKTPVINQSFPVEVHISNNSDGNAMEIEIEFEFPEDLKMMRGTLKKNIYSLSPNEDMHWQILVKAFDVGEIPIRTVVTFKDEDGNRKGPFSADIPITINL
ncbi:MAG: hypothetical protein K9W44_13330 [Candidatus Lokiarchaeota archaeon]|nr:hypothetical protein [Candidatus Harpocratesius repetitus]